MLRFRETASLRASLKVYVIGLPFHRAPRLSPNRSPKTTTTLGLQGLYEFWGVNSTTRFATVTKVMTLLVLLNTLRWIALYRQLM